MPGTYSAQSPCAQITLIVNRDHTFLQLVKTGNVELNRLSGKWKFDQSSKTLDFTQFLDFHEDFHGRVIGFFSAPADLLPKGVTMGPIIVQCQDSGYEVDFVK